MRRSRGTALLVVGLLASFILGAGSARADTPFTLSLAGPSEYVPDQAIAPFVGRLLGPAGLGLPLTSVDVRVDGVSLQTVTTDLQGRYQVVLPPFSGINDHTVQTVAFQGVPSIETWSPLLHLRVKRYRLTVSMIGTGQGTVTSTPAGINCPGVCWADFPAASMVTLSAAPSADSTFGGWSAACFGALPDCDLTMSGPLTARARFDAAGKISISPATYDFGNVSVFNPGFTQAQFTVRNTGSGPTGVVNASLGGADAADFAILTNGCGGVGLAPGQTCVVSVTFRPSSAGAKSATLTASASPGGSASSALQGTGAVGVLSINPSSYDYGKTSVFNPPAAQAQFTIRNIGNGNTGFVSASLGGADAAEFAIITNGCGGIMLAPGQTCVITVQFHPMSAGAKSATLQATATPGGTVSAALQGTGTVGTLSIAPASYDFGSVPITAPPSAPTQFTVRNIGDGNTGFVNASLGGANAADFVIVTNGCGGILLMPGQTCVVSVQFRPATAGAKSASLIASASPGGTATSSLSGTGV
ncbi:MAG: hypothetical protein NVSMB57_09300 [Actinomycetota bacterium]